MAKKYVPVFFEWLDVTSDLSQEEKGNLIDAMIFYASGERNYDDIIAALNKCELISFRHFKGVIDRNAILSETRSKAGSTRKQDSGTDSSKPEQTETKAVKEE